MKAENQTTGHSRSIHVTEIPGETPELTIDIAYRGGNSALKGICLDHEIVPTVVKGLNLLPEIEIIIGEHIRGLQTAEHACEEIHELFARHHHETHS